AFDCHAFKRNRQEECVQMPVKIARSTPRPSFGLRELLVASHISRLASRDAAKSLLSTSVSESSGECRLTSTNPVITVTSTNVSSIDRATWMIGPHDLVDVAQRAFEALSALVQP